MDGCCEWKQPRNVGSCILILESPMLVMEGQEAPKWIRPHFPLDKIPPTNPLPFLIFLIINSYSPQFFLSYLGRLETKKKNEVRNSPSNFYHNKAGKWLVIKIFHIHHFLQLLLLLLLLLFHFFYFFIFLFYFFFFKYLSC